MIRIRPLATNSSMVASGMVPQGFGFRPPVHEVGGEHGGAGDCALARSPARRSRSWAPISAHRPFFVLRRVGRAGRAGSRSQGSIINLNLALPALVSSCSSKGTRSTHPSVGPRPARHGARSPCRTRRCTRTTTTHLQLGGSSRRSGCRSPAPCNVATVTATWALVLATPSVVGEVRHAGGVDDDLGPGTLRAVVHPPPRRRWPPGRARAPCPGRRPRARPLLRGLHHGDVVDSAVWPRAR